MFKFEINTPVVIKGCPEHGIEAVDFRRKHGLPDGTDNKLTVVCCFESEALARKYKDSLNHQADFIGKSSNWIGYAPPTPECSVEACQAFLGHGSSGEYESMDWETITGEIITSHAAHNRLRKEEEEQRKRENAEREARRAEAFAEAEIRDRLNREEKEKKALAGLEKLKDWATANGSPLLKARIENGFEWVDLARREFAKSVVKATVEKHHLDDVTEAKSDNCDDRNTPTLEEIQILVELRKEIGDRGSVDILRMKYIDDIDGSVSWYTEAVVEVTCPDDCVKVLRYRVE